MCGLVFAAEGKPEYADSPSAMSWLELAARKGDAEAKGLLEEARKALCQLDQAREVAT